MFEGMGSNHTHVPLSMRRVVRLHGVPVEVQETICRECLRPLGKQTIRRVVA
jgi:hypothetical protein